GPCGNHPSRSRRGPSSSEEEPDYLQYLPLPRRAFPIRGGGAGHSPVCSSRVATVLELGPQQVQEFFDRGFTVVPGVFAPAEIDEMRAAFDRLEKMARALGTTGMHRGSQFVLERYRDDAGAEQVRIHRIVWCGAAEPVLARYGRDPRLLQ